MNPLDQKLDQKIDQQLDQKIAEALSDRDARPRSGPARILVVAPLSDCRISIVSMLETRRHHVTCAGRVDEARALLSRSRFDLVLLSDTLSDGSGLDLTSLIQKTSPTTHTIVIAESVAPRVVIQAMRCGAADFITVPPDFEDFITRIDSALIKSRVVQEREDRLTRLKKICRELNTARQEISKQVDTLCSDLVNAYQEVSEQISDASMASEFRTLLKQELDVEDLLRTTLEYMLTKTGPTNAAVFLPDNAGNYGLGAYVNYDCPRETIGVLLDHLCHAICPQMAGERELIRFDDADEFADWIGTDDASFLADSQVIAFSCRLKNDCLAVMVLFRNKTKPFSDGLPGTLDTMRGIIAEQLANVIKVHHRANASWPKEASDGDMDYDDDMGFGYQGGMAA